jgi:DNA-binding GntR family transcriptional regulator
VDWSETVTAVVNVAPLSVQIEQAIKEEIVSGRLTPGQRIDMDELSHRWGVSITPVRDALRRLEVAGFLTVAPRRGVYVAAPDQQQFKEIFDLRIALECLAIESAIALIPQEDIVALTNHEREALQVFRDIGERGLLIKYDPIIHDLILRYCGNRKLVEIMDGLSDLIRWTRNIVVQDQSTYEAAVPEHIRILDALRARDADAATQAMRAHLRNSFRRTGKIPVYSDNDQ